MSRPLHLVVMGVAGIGKSTVAGRLATDLDLEFAEGDDFHPPANVAKMSRGEPLTDEDRSPWLESLAAWTRERHDSGRSTVVTCSALRRAYRDSLRRGAPETFFVHLHGDAETIRRRMESRQHFMPVELLRSQLDTLEPLADDESGMVVDATLGLDAIATLVERRIESGQ
ncbi:MAG TPA: gluconokinase [Nocardioidaceae bacterium]|nr:gluconokinase [Nocardioidaceae bacterium]